MNNITELCEPFLFRYCYCCCCCCCGLCKLFWFLQFVYFLREGQSRWKKKKNENFFYYFILYFSFVARYSSFSSRLCFLFHCQRNIYISWRGQRATLCSVMIFYDAHYCLIFSGSRFFFSLVCFVLLLLFFSFIL